MNISQSAQAPSPDRDKQTGYVALKAFFCITHEWGCSTDERRQLLGEPARTTLTNYSKLPHIKLAKDTLERISHVIGIYSALRMLYPTHERANRRVRLPTKDAPFWGDSPIEFMCKGSMEHLAIVHRYFDAQRGGDFS